MDKLINKNLIISMIETLIYHGNDEEYGNVALLHLDGYYMQFLSRKGAYEIYCEAVSNYYLDEHESLNESQINQLLTLGWQTPKDGEGNFFMNYKIDSEKARENLAEIIVKTSQEVYHLPFLEEDHLELQM